MYGVHPVREALRAGRPIDRLYLLRGRRDPETDDLTQSAKAGGASVHYEPRDVLDRLAGTTKHQGVVAIVAAQGAVSLDDLLDRLKTRANSSWPPLLVILDEVEDPHNLGAVIRTAEAAGAHGVIIPERRAAGLTPAVAKTSAGALSYLPVARVGNLGQAMARLKEAGIWLMGLEVHAKMSYWETDWKMPVALIAGAEGKGLRPLVKERCDQLISLPMRGRMDSLNVSVAVGIVLYEILRQRCQPHSQGFAISKAYSEPETEQERELRKKHYADLLKDEK